MQIIQVGLAINIFTNSELDTHFPVDTTCITMVKFYLNLATNHGISYEGGLMSNLVRILM